MGKKMRNNKYTVRIEGITLQNFKNIGNGSVYFNEFKKLERKDYCEEDFSNVLGIYGQNASGKTSVIEALSIIRHIICSGGCNVFLRQYIKKNTNAFLISLSFLLTKQNKKIMATYTLCVKSEASSIFIENESLSSFELDKKQDQLGNKKTLFGYTKGIGLKDSFLSSIESKDDRTILNYLAYQKTNIPLTNMNFKMYSALFNNETIEIIKKDKNLTNLTEIVIPIIDFCRNKFLIVKTNLFDGLNEKGIGLNGFDFDENDDRIHKNFSIFFGKQRLEKTKYNDFLKMLNESSKILQTLVPGLLIQSHIYNKILSAKGEEIIEFEVMSIRNKCEIPLLLESRGVKQMLTYVGDLIGVFNHEGTFIAIDELDSGVFEYLLGEIIYAFDNFANGQLLFTSHNFRILEKIKPCEIFFTTTDEMNRFVQPKYVKNNNNLRDVYYRLIVQGDEKETYYNKASSIDIVKTFSSLGKDVK